MDLQGTRRSIAAVAGVFALAAGCGRWGTQRLVEIRRAWPVMGTMLTITAWGRDSATALAAVGRGRQAVQRVDSLMSSYRASSDVARMSASPGVPVRVSAETMSVLRKAREYWRISGGKFDPTVGPLMDAWGISRDSGKIPSRSMLDSARALVGFERVEIDTIASTVRLPVKGMRIDLGGIAKGYALDLARRAMAPQALAGMVDLGGNVLVFGKSQDSDGRWRIGVLHPRRDGRIIGTLTLDSGAVATSGDYEQFFVAGGVRYSHIMDVAAGKPAQGVISATAAGSVGEWSDGMSATLFLLGPIRGIVVADSLSGIVGIVIRDPGTRELRRSDVHLSARAAGIFQFDQFMR